MYNDNPVIKVKAIKINQNSYTFYICKLSSDILKKISSTSIKSMGTENEIYQRSLDNSRVKRISKFIERDESIMPTAIILNSKEDLNYDDNTMTIKISKKPDSCFIVDGQHRIEGANKSNKNFDFVVVILEKIETSLQTEMFVTINSEQKRVNPSVRFNLYANDKEKTPERVVRKIAHLLNVDKNSPLFGRIKMDDSKQKQSFAQISLAAFANPIVELIYNSQDYFDIKDDLKKYDCYSSITEEFNQIHILAYKDRLFWDLFVTNQEVIIHKVIYNYFTAVKRVFINQWEDKKSIICKTTGYNALILVLRELLVMGKEKKSYKHDFFYENIIKAKEISEKLYVDYFGLGKIASYKLYSELMNYIFNGNSTKISFLDSMVDED